MTPEAEPHPKVEIAHVLNMDVVGYSTLLITEQSRLMSELTRIVKSTARFRRADGLLLARRGPPCGPLRGSLRGRLLGFPARFLA